MADVIQVLTGTVNPNDYIKKMRKRDNELAKGWVQFVLTLLVETSGGEQKMGMFYRKRTFTHHSIYSFSKN